MSYLEPNSSPVVPGGPPWQPDDTDGDGRDAWARHLGAAPDPFAADDGYGVERTGGFFAEPYDGTPTGTGGPDGVPTVDVAATAPDGRPVPTTAERAAAAPNDSAAAPDRPAGAPDRAVPAPDGAVAAVPATPRRGRRRAGRRPVDLSATGRAGRNLPAAIGVGLGLLVLVLGPLFVWRPAFVAVMAVAVVIGSWEMVRAVGAVRARPPLVPLLAGGVLMIGLAWYAGPDALSLGLLVTLLATAVWRLADGFAGYRRDLTAATLIVVYVPFLAGFAVLLASAGDGQFRVLVTLAAVVFSDTGGYLFGVLFGKHPMAPTISPKKSWEGFAGSVATTAVGSAALLWLLLDVTPWQGALFGAVLSVAAVLGDLSESMLKRDLGIKDMSQLLPGHGGLMDRLDSILLAVPPAYLMLLVIAPPT